MSVTGCENGSESWYETGITSSQTISPIAIDFGSQEEIVYFPSPKVRRLVGTCKNCQFSFRIMPMLTSSDFCSKGTFPFYLLFNFHKLTLFYLSIDCQTCFTFFKKPDCCSPVKFIHKTAKATQNEIRQVKQDIFAFQNLTLKETIIDDVDSKHVTTELKLQVIETSISDGKSSGEKKKSITSNQSKSRFSWNVTPTVVNKNASKNRKRF